VIKSGHPKDASRSLKARMNWQHFLDLIHHELASGIVATSIIRLLLAAFLGGAIGLEREYKHRPAGLRTNMFICFGAAMFTLLSAQLAGVPSDAARIAAQIIPGIGFIGAGSIIHTRGLTTGLTTAATIFVVASVGMAAGGGLYVTAAFATMLVLGSLFLLGYVEEAFNIKLLISSYEVTGATLDEVSHEVNRILESHHRLMQNVLTGETTSHIRLQFDVEGCAGEQRELFRQLKMSTVFSNAVSLGRVERE
jgi:putative Mg2+ transporter-C (MgtC) family protein